MNYTYTPEFVRSEVGFWILSRKQTYFILISMLIVSGVLSSSGLNIIISLALSSLLGGITGALAGSRFNGVYGYEYLLRILIYYFEYLFVSGGRDGVAIYASAYPTGEIKEKTFRFYETPERLPESLE